MKRRTLNSDEKLLWQRVTDTVKGLHITPPSTPATAARAPLPKRKTYAAPLSAQVTTQSAQKSVHRQPLLEAGDPRMTRHVRRGRIEIDATLDLHGMTQDQAQNALSQFILLSKARGDRVVLVITGKGFRLKDHTDNSYSVSRGILRERFVQWAESIFRPHISSIKQAHQRHGGSGAFYVFLKKADSR
ncbi:Smr/MutS family protein [Parvularcula sp. IMCC14364]|uniref:Smr/MutS family protein n=1 Tax=Parvularcula sp. IMCC14364 TaxID=3067902 RepID=UPI0027405D76|nr:Smr/MutS family protein [Parvularcula sp. IMCC14364]